MLTCSSIYRWTRVCLLIEVFVLPVCVCSFFLPVCVCVAFCCLFVFFRLAVVLPVVVAVAVTVIVVTMSRQHLKLETVPVA